MGTSGPFLGDLRLPQRVVAVAVQGAQAVEADGQLPGADLGRGRLRQRRHQRPPAPFHHVIDPLSQPGGFSAAGRADHPELVGPHLSFPHPCQLILRGGLPAPESVSPSPVLHLPARAGFPQAPLRRGPRELRRPPVEKSPFIFMIRPPPRAGEFFCWPNKIFSSRVYRGTGFSPAQAVDNVDNRGSQPVIHENGPF